MVRRFNEGAEVIPITQGTDADRYAKLLKAKHLIGEVVAELKPQVAAMVGTNETPAPTYRGVYYKIEPALSGLETAVRIMADQLRARELPPDVEISLDPSIPSLND